MPVINQFQCPAFSVYQYVSRGNSSYSMCSVGIGLQGICSNHFATIVMQAAGVLWLLTCMLVAVLAGIEEAMSLT